MNDARRSLDELFEPPRAPVAPMESPALASIALLRDRIARLPACLAEVMERPWDDAIATLEGDVVVTGIGASAGPARLFAWLLAHRLRLAARFVPLSAFAVERPPAGRALVVISQGLSPNARLALRHAPSFERVLVLTSRRPTNTGTGELLADVQARGGAVIVLPPDDEEGTLLRVIGPACATLAACSIVESAASGSDLGAVRRALSSALASARGRALAALAHVTTEELDGPCAFVSIGVDPSAVESHRWKWLEGLCAGEPFGWDLLEIAHGPIQSARRPMPFLVFAGAPGASSDLQIRLAHVLGPAGHPLAVLHSELPFPFAIVDHDAQLDALLLRVLDERPRDLRSGASGAHDAPLYDLGR